MWPPSENNTFTAAIPKSTHSEDATVLCVKYKVPFQRLDVCLAYAHCMYACSGRRSVERALLNFGAVLVFCCLSVYRPRALHPLSLSQHPPIPVVLLSHPPTAATGSFIYPLLDEGWSMCVFVFPTAAKRQTFDL